MRRTERNKDQLSTLEKFQLITDIAKNLVIMLVEFFK